MSKPVESQSTKTKGRQTLMRDFFSKADKTPKSPAVTASGSSLKKSIAASGAQSVSSKQESSKDKVRGTEKTIPTKDKPAKENIEEKPFDIEKRPSLKRKATGAGMFSWGRASERDTEEYRNGYPGKKDNPGLDDNYKFYTNKIPSEPDGDFIDKIHVDWWGNYKLLEIHHGYIQWLFPIRESGLNWHAQELQLHEIKKLQKNKTAMKRILTSYKMMLDFYGMKLVNEDDGTIERADNWQERFKHLNRSFHNYLRITRILKCLGEFGYEHLKKNFIKFVLNEGFIEGTLYNVIDSCFKYWIGVLKDDNERTEMYEYYYKLKEDEENSGKRRRRSPSPPSPRHSWNNDLETKENGEPGAVEDEGEEKGKGDEKIKKEWSDDDETLEIAMKIIDDRNDLDNNEGKESRQKNGKERKDHEMSDSDTDVGELTEESQEMTHWKQEAKKSGEAELAAGSESCEGFPENYSGEGEQNGTLDKDVPKRDMEKDIALSQGDKNSETPVEIPENSREIENLNSDISEDVGSKENGEPGAVEDEGEEKGKGDEKIKKEWSDDDETLEIAMKIIDEEDVAEGNFEQSGNVYDKSADTDIEKLDIAKAGDTVASEQAIAQAADNGNKENIDHIDEDNQNATTGVENMVVEEECMETGDCKVDAVISESKEVSLDKVKQDTAAMELENDPDLSAPNGPSQMET